ncbi:MAG: amidohydrolase family protein [Steroidobacteraceae bacterium]
MQIVPEGWESVTESLRKAQEEQLAAARRAQSARLSRVPEGPLVIEHANLFDSEARRMRPRTTVVIEGKLIQAVGADGKVPIPARSRPTEMLADSEPEARRLVQAIAAAGFQLVKIYSSVKPELVPAIVDEARKQGLRVGGHIPAFMTAEHAAELDQGSAKTKALIALLVQRKVTVDPTLQIFENLILDRPGTMARSYADVADRLPVSVRRDLMDGGLPVPEGMEARFQDSFRAMQRMLLALHDAGVPIVAGTDSGYGFALIHELELYVAAGIPAAEVLQMATLGAARATGFGERLGSIAPRKLADMILVDGDPSVDPGVLRELRMVFKDGVPLDTTP